MTAVAVYELDVFYIYSGRVFYGTRDKSSAKGYRVYIAGFELESFDHLDVNDRVYCLQVMLESLAYINGRFLRRYPRTLGLYQAVPQYVIKRRPFDIDRWQDIPRTIRLRSGDCKDFVCWRIAELRMQGEPEVGPHVKVQQIRDLIVYHITVRRGFQEEDPSAILGMPQNATYEQLKG